MFTTRPRVKSWVLPKVMAQKLLRAKAFHDDVQIRTFGKPGRIGYTVEIAAGSEMETMLGPDRTTSPYFSCICICMSWACFVFTHHTRGKLVRLARKGPGIRLSRHQVRKSCKVKSVNTTPRSSREPLSSEKLFRSIRTSLLCTIAIALDLLLESR